MTQPKSKLFKSAPASGLNPDFDPGSPAASEQARSTLLERMQAEIKDCLEALGFAEQAIRQQNDVLEATQHALQEERLHYQGLVRALPYAVLVTSTQGIIRAANTSAAALLGVSARYLAGKSFALYARRSERLAFLQELTQMFPTEGRILRRRMGLPAACAKSSAIKNEQGATIGLLWLLEISGTFDVSGTAKA